MCLLLKRLAVSVHVGKEPVGGTSKCSSAFLCACSSFLQWSVLKCPEVTFSYKRKKCTVGAW